ncbi:MAG: glycosyltransferase family 2 protein [Lachnospiraceae bacterium]|nr:glycosyltransferase family 2 protein [Lachnospiraceae bacterium]
MSDLISVIVPCYNEETALPLFYEELHKVIETMNNVEFEVLFIDDGSSDNTRNVILDLESKYNNVRYVFFSRNFGKDAAMKAGLDHATGDYVVIMDADLQDPPALLPEMYSYVSSGEYDSAATRRVTRKGEPPIRSFFARMFYKLMGKISDADIMDGARDYRMMNRKFVGALLQMKEYNWFSKGIFGSVGFKTKWIEFENVERVAGETKWSFWKLFKYSIEGIVAFSTTPLVLSSAMGLLMCLVAIIFVIFIIVRKLLYGDPVAGWPSMVCIISFIAGIQMFSLGIIGQYLAKTYLEVKRRPMYIIDEKNTNDKKEEVNVKEEKEA